MRFEGNLAAILVVYEPRKFFGTKTAERFAASAALFELALARVLEHEARGEAVTTLEEVTQRLHGEYERKLATLEQQLMRATGEFVAAGGDPGRVVADAWDLAGVAEAYRGFVARFGRLRPSGPEAVFRAQTLLVHEWRRFPFLDPDLPDELLPGRWPRRRAHELFADRHDRWHATAQSHFAALEATGGAPAAAA
jgi:DNA-binding transcriptional regulator PaaX